MRNGNGGQAAGGPSGPAKQADVTPRVLVVDDEPDICAVLRHLLEQQGYSVTTETTALAALERAVAGSYDLLLSDVAMPEMDGIALCEKLAAARPGLPVVLLTGRANMETVTRALRAGVRDFLTKPLESAALLDSVARLVGRPDQEALVPSREGGREPEGLRLTGLLGESEVMRKLRRLILDLADSVASVVIQGETGTGKEVVARALHATSPLRAGPFIALNCAAMPAGLLESELFGHRRGAFTDAKTSKKGLLQQAEGGTLLLDEMSELPLSMQPKLLRALQERTVRPVGDHQEIPFNCRIVAAVNQDLDAEVRAKRFREDLYYRLDVVRIMVPPLRERGGDVLLLARHFLQRYQRRTRGIVALSDAAAAKLSSYDWPGNVRELENAMERAVALASSDELTVEDLPERIQLPPTERVTLPAPDPRALDATSLFEAEREHVLRTVAQLDGNKTRAAAVLGIDRRTLYRRLERYESRRTR